MGKGEWVPFSREAIMPLSVLASFRLGSSFNGRNLLLVHSFENRLHLEVLYHPEKQI